MRPPALRAGLAAAALLAGPLAAQGPVAVTRPHVTISLVPEVPAVVPGRPFGLAVRLDADLGWHVYWRNPGVAGIATSIEWDLPPAFALDSLAWPVPEYYDVSGIVTHVLHGTTVVRTTVTPPARAAASPVRIRATLRYGICREVCIPGDAEVTLVLPWGGPGQDPASAGPALGAGAWREAVGAFDARRPRAGGPALAAALRDTTLLLTVRAAGGLPDTLTFFASDRGVLPAAVRVVVPKGAREATLRLPIMATPARLQGVLVGRAGEGWPVDARLGSRE